MANYPETRAEILFLYTECVKRETILRGTKEPHLKKEAYSMADDLRDHSRYLSEIIVKDKPLMTHSSILKRTREIITKSRMYM